MIEELRNLAFTLLSYHRDALQQEGDLARNWEQFKHTLSELVITFPAIDDTLPDLPLDYELGKLWGEIEKEAL